MGFKPCIRCANKNTSTQLFQTPARFFERHDLKKHINITLPHYNLLRVKAFKMTEIY